MSGFLQFLSAVWRRLSLRDPWEQPVDPRDTAGAGSGYRILLMHSMDPRGRKFGGIETHIRLLLRFHPRDFSIVFVGFDEHGDCEIGKVSTVVVDGREIDFLPVAYMSTQELNDPAKHLSKSATLLCLLGALRHLAAIRAALKPCTASADVHRFEFAIIPKLLGLKTVQMIHSEGVSATMPGGLFHRFHHLNRFTEWLALRLADRILCVNATIASRITHRMPRARAKTAMMPVPVDTGRFSPTPFDCSDGVFRVVFAGRLDDIKDPALMFRILRRLHQHLAGKVEFNYVGAYDPGEFPEFAAIESFSRRAGLQDAAGVAQVIGRCHAGILTSFSEGMPCFLLEALSCGRPFCALYLPQLDPLAIEGVSGVLVRRTVDPDACIEEMAMAFAGLWRDIQSGLIVPDRVHELVDPYSVTQLLGKLFAYHRALQTCGDTSVSCAAVADPGPGGPS